MNEKRIAELLRAAAAGQTEPFYRDGATWSGNALQEAMSAAASFRMMAEVFEKAAMADEPKLMGCICPPTSEQTCQNPLCPRKAPPA